MLKYVLFNDFESMLLSSLILNNISLFLAPLILLASFVQQNKFSFKFWHAVIMQNFLQNFYLFLFFYVDLP